MKLEALKHQGKATSGQVIQKLSVEKVPDEANENYKTVQRYIRAILSGQEVRPAPTEESIMLYRLLSGMSNNINQLTMLAHIHGGVSQADIRKIEAFRKELWQLCRAVLDGESVKRVAS